MVQYRKKPTQIEISAATTEVAKETVSVGICVMCTSERRNKNQHNRPTYAVKHIHYSELNKKK